MLIACTQLAKYPRVLYVKPSNKVYVPDGMIIMYILLCKKKSYEMFNKLNKSTLDARGLHAEKEIIGLQVVDKTTRLQAIFVQFTS